MPRSRRADHLGECRHRLFALQPRKADKTVAEVGSGLEMSSLPADGAYLHNNGRLFPPNHLHDSWLDFLYWDVELDP